MAEQADRELAVSLLSRALVGSTVNGVRFGALQLLFDTLNVPGEPVINLSSAWCVYASRPESFPDSEADVPGDDESQESEIMRASSLRHRIVASVEILSPWPHLLLTFDDGSVLYLNGKNDQYEPWTAALTHAPEDHKFMVIACPGGGLTFVLPRAGV